MSSFTLTFSTDGAAFADNPQEIERIVQQVADVLRYTRKEGADTHPFVDDRIYRVRDVDGNRVGFFIHAVESVMADAQ
jgi:hypothetical protein